MTDFTHLDLPYEFKEFWSKYPHGYSIYEAMLDWLKQTNDMTDYLNITSAKIDAFYVEVDTTLQGYAEEQLLSWLSDGTLETVILTSFQEQLDLLQAQIVITPENFEGTDFQKVQQALDYATTYFVSIDFKKIYDITGQGTLVINKPNGSWDTDRRMLYLNGIGGGLRKDDAGFMFTGSYANVGDITVTNMKYFGVPSTGMCVWDADKLIRINSDHCTYIGVDTVASAPTRYFQSMRFTHEYITGGGVSAWAFEFRKLTDTVIENCVIEARGNGIRNTEALAEVQNVGLRILNCCLEGFGGYAIKLGSCHSTTISDNYFELNLLGHIDMITLNNFYHYGVTIQGNYFKQTAEQITAQIPAINIGKIYSGSGSLISIANTVNGSGAILYNIYASEGGWITAQGDNATIRATGKTSRYTLIERQTIYTEALGSTQIKWGGVSSQTVSTVSTSFTAGEVKSFDMATAVPPLAGDVVSFNVTNSANFQVLSSELIANACKVWVKNIGATTQSTIITMNVFKMF